MPLYSVTVSMETTMVVQAEDEDHAWEVAHDNARRGFEDAGEAPSICVTGEVRTSNQLRDGWDTLCLPYGGDGNTMIKDLL